jgi:hypothetical protein
MSACALPRPDNTYLDVIQETGDKSWVVCHQIHIFAHLSSAIFVTCTNLKPDLNLKKRWEDFIDFGDSRREVSFLGPVMSWHLTTMAASPPERPLFNALWHDAGHNPGLANHCLYSTQRFEDAV